MRKIRTFAVLALISRPMNLKFERLRLKYGVFEN